MVSNASTVLCVNRLWSQQWKNGENQHTTEKVTTKINLAVFLTSSVNTAMICIIKNHQVTIITYNNSKQNNIPGKNITQMHKVDWQKDTNGTLELQCRKWVTAIGQEASQWHSSISSPTLVWSLAPCQQINEINTSSSPPPPPQSP